MRYSTTVYFKIVDSYYNKNFGPLITAIVKNQWFLESALPLNEWFEKHPLEPIVWQCFLVWQLLVTMEWSWFSMVCNHWSNDGMVTIHRCGLYIFQNLSHYNWWFASAKLKNRLFQLVILVHVSFFLRGQFRR